MLFIKYKYNDEVRTNYKRKLCNTICLPFYLHRHNFNKFFIHLRYKLCKTKLNRCYYIILTYMYIFV